MYLVATSLPRITSEHGADIVFLDETLENYTKDWSSAKLFDSYDDAIEESKIDMSNEDFVIHENVVVLKEKYQRQRVEWEQEKTELLHTVSVLSEKLSTMSKTYHQDQFKYKMRLNCDRIKSEVKKDVETEFCELREWKNKVRGWIFGPSTETGVYGMECLVKKIKELESSPWGIPWKNDNAIYRYGSDKFGIMESDKIPEKDGVFDRGTVWFAGDCPPEYSGKSEIRTTVDKK
jgi:hypothetical protein